MANNVVDFSSRQQAARNDKKEEKLEKMQKRFEKALPTEEKDGKKKLLGIFKGKGKGKGTGKGKPKK